jgi:hypothetical protein
MANEFPYNLLSPNVPNQSCFVVTGSGQEVAIRRETDRTDEILVFLKLFFYRFILNIPQINYFII